VRVVRLLVDQVKQVLGTRVVEPLPEAHRVAAGCGRPERRLQEFPGLPGAPRRGAEHQVRRNAAIQQPPAGRTGIPAATTGQRALDVIDPGLAGRLGMPQHQERTPATHRRRLPSG
jgi:hypothetical protein